MTEETTAAAEAAAAVAVSDVVYNWDLQELIVLKNS